MREGGHTMYYWYLDAIRNYAVFSGRTHRKAFWMFVLFDVIIAIVLTMIDGILGMGLLGLLYSLALLIPRLAVSARRLHDADRTGWWLLISLIPVIGILVLIFFWIQPGTTGDNQYGPEPASEIV
jgi:uncharacterized membrane protein YhaH (DUF805 family)